MLHCEARPERRAVLPRPAQQSETHQPSPRPNPAQPPSPAQPSPAEPAPASPAQPSPAQPPAQPSCPVPANKTPSNSLSPANLTNSTTKFKTWFQSTKLSVTGQPDQFDNTKERLAGRQATVFSPANRTLSSKRSRGAARCEEFPHPKP